MRSCKLRIIYLSGDLKFLKNNYVMTICSNVLKFFPAITSPFFWVLSSKYSLLAFNLAKTSVQAHPVPVCLPFSSRQIPYSPLRHN